MDLVHGDLCGPITPATPGGRRYFLLLIDDATRYMWISLLAMKGDAAAAIKKFKAATELEVGRPLRVLRTDNGGEFTAKEFADFCVNAGVQRHFSAPYMPQQNGVVEHRNQSVLATARALLKERGMQRGTGVKPSPLPCSSSTGLRRRRWRTRRRLRRTMAASRLWDSSRPLAAWRLSRTSDRG